MVAATNSGGVLLELGGVLLALALAGRLAARLRLPTIPLYLLTGLLLGEGSRIPLTASEEFIRIGAELGVVMLLLLLGLEYTPTELRHGLRSGWAAGAVDLVANSVPGFLTGLLLGWHPVAALLLAGVTYISSSGIIAKQLSDLERIANRETSAVLTILVIEDLAMAVYLPLVGVLIAGVDPAEGAASIVLALTLVAVALVVSFRFGDHISRVLETSSSELLLITVLGITLLIGGLAERVQVSAAVAAFLVGVMLSGQVAERGRQLLVPIRDVFGGLFFLFFGLQVDPGSLTPVLVPALLLAATGVVSKALTGWWAAKHAGVGARGRIRSAASLVPRGEFSIVIAGLGVSAGSEAELGPLTAAYVLILAVAGSLLMRYADAFAPGLRAVRARRVRPAP